MEWIEFYSFVFVIFGLIAVARTKLKAIRGEEESLLDENIGFRQEDAFGWWAFSSLFIISLLIPVWSHIISYFFPDYVIFSNPVLNTFFVIFFAIGPVFMAFRHKIERGELTVESITLKGKLRPLNDYLFFFEFVLLFPWMNLTKFRFLALIILMLFLIPPFNNVSYVLVLSIIPSTLVMSHVFQSFEPKYEERIDNN